MGDYASKGVAGSGLGLGIAGTALGVLNGANNGNGLLGGLFGGGNNNAVSQLQSENAMLKAQKYSDNNAKEVYMQSLTDNRNLDTKLTAKDDALIENAHETALKVARMEEQIKCCCEKQELREQILTGKINEVALTTKGRFDVLDQTIACLAGDVRNNARAIADITDTIVPITKVCPQPMPRYNSYECPSQETSHGNK